MRCSIVKSHSHQTIYEEVINALSHAIAAGLSIAGLVALIDVALNTPHQIMKIVSAIIFGLTLIILYSASTIYHSINHKRTKRICRIIDHISIYLLIAGTYTPICLIILHGVWGWSLLLVVWSLTLLGIIFKIFFVGRFEIFSIVIYIGMGWLAVVAIEPLRQVLPIKALMWLLIGGGFYTSGLLFYALNRIRFAHSLWHLFVIAGSACHYFVILLFAMPLSF